MNRLGVGVTLKYIEIEREFSRYGGQIPPARVEFLPDWSRVAPAEPVTYSLDNRTARYHRTQIRQALGSGWRRWLTTNVAGH